MPPGTVDDVGSEPGAAACPDVEVDVDVVVVGAGWLRWCQVVDVVDGAGPCVVGETVPGASVDVDVVVVGAGWRWWTGGGGVDAVDPYGLDVGVGRVGVSVHTPVGSAVTVVEVVPSQVVVVLGVPSWWW